MRQWQHSRLQHHAIHSNLYQHKSLYPILALICKSSDHLLDGMVLPLCLTISLRVVSASISPEVGQLFTFNYPKGTIVPKCWPKAVNALAVLKYCCGHARRTVWAMLASCLAGHHARCSHTLQLLGSIRIPNIPHNAIPKAAVKCTLWSCMTYHGTPKNLTQLSKNSYAAWGAVS